MQESPILNDYVFAKQVCDAKRIKTSVWTDWKYAAGGSKQDNDPILISFLNSMLDGEVHVKTAKILNSVIHCNVLYDSIGRVIA